MGLEELVRSTFEAHWREPGYTCPSAERYPWQWLWDSCFHSIIWARLGDADRAVTELRTALAGQDPGSGFVPHVAYWASPDHHADFWGRSGFSSITQPPMFGHAVAELVRGGIEVPEDVVGSSVAGLRFLLERRRRSAGGLVELAHPWESGADDSPRWDDLTASPFDLPTWKARKGELVASVVRDDGGSPVANDLCPVASVGFNALVAFNSVELGVTIGDDGLVAAGTEVAGRLSERWDADRSTWVDDGPTAAGSGRACTLDALLGALVDPHHADAALDLLIDPSAHGAPFGPTGVHRAEPTFAADTYWRGPAWPQLSYLLWVAARRARRDDVARPVAASLVAAAVHTGLAEYWNPDTAAPGGAAPQSWTGLAVVVDAPTS